MPISQLLKSTYPWLTRLTLNQGPTRFRPLASWRATTSWWTSSKRCSNRRLSPWRWSGRIPNSHKCTIKISMVPTHLNNTTHSTKLRWPVKLLLYNKASSLLVREDQTRECKCNIRITKEGNCQPNKSLSNKHNSTTMPLWPRCNTCSKFRTTWSSSCSSSSRWSSKTNRHHNMIINSWGCLRSTVALKVYLRSCRGRQLRILTGRVFCRISVIVLRIRRVSTLQWSGSSTASWVSLSKMVGPSVRMHRVRPRKCHWRRYARARSSRRGKMWSDHRDRSPSTTTHS